MSEHDEILKEKRKRRRRAQERWYFTQPWPRPQFAHGGESFSPLDIPDVLTWWDFSDISVLFQDTSAATPVTADADPIGRINDKSPNGHNLTQGTDNKRPLYKTGIVNGLSVARFDGTNDLLSVTTPAALATSFTIFFVHDGSAISTGKYWISWGDGALGEARQIQSAANDSINLDFWSVAANGDTDIEDGSAHSLLCTWDETTGKIYRDDVLDGEDTIAENAYTGTTLRVGANVIGGNWFDADITEIAIYDRVLTAAEITSLHEYSARWGVAA